MRKMRLFVMLMAIAAVSFTFTSCDDGKRLRVYTLHNSKKAVTAD